MSPMPERMSDHWWWRPGVRPGRPLLVWHILPDDQPAARTLVRAYQDRLTRFRELDLIPAEWLHMTTQIVGFGDEISAAEVDAMTEAVAKRLRALDPVTVELGRMLFHAEGIVLGVRPARALEGVREAVREAVAETVTVHQLDDEPEWTPHMSVAYSNATGPAAPIIAALRKPRPDPRPFRVASVHLVAQERIGHLYRWERLAVVNLGT